MISVVLQISKKAFSLYLLTLFIFTSFLLGNQSAKAQVELFENGGFETGDFTGWTVVQQPGSGGDWFVYSGTTSPFDIPILPPPEGTYAAVTDQQDPSSQVLFQDVDVPVGTAECSVIVYYENRAGEEGEEVRLREVDAIFVNGPNLNFDEGPNQQARIDIMDPLAPNFDIGAGVLLNIFQTNPGDPASLGYTTLNFDLSDFAGTTVRFRAAEVDNLGVFNFSIDDVTCGINTAQIPTLSEWGLIAMAGVLGIIGLLAIRRRKVAA